MATPIRIKRSAVPNKKPTTDQIQLGELALNTFDGKIFLKQDQGGVGIATRIIQVNANEVGNTFFVNKNGNDDDTGESQDRAFLTIKKAVGIASRNDAIHVGAGQYLEDNPLVLDDSVTIIGGDIRNCKIEPANPDKDIIQLGQAGTVQDLSFVGVADSGSAVISYRPLVGVSSDRFFDAARLIRKNLDFIANEAVGYITSTDYKNPAITIDSVNCADDIKDIYKAVCHDITRGGNSKSIGAGKSYFDIDGNLDHIVGFGSTTIDVLNYSRNIARAVINNATWGSTGAGSTTNVTGAQYGKTTGILTVTSASHGLSKDDPVKLVGLAFTCPGGSGITTTIFPDGKYGSIFPVKDVVGVNTFEVVVGISTIDHTYDTGGTVEKHQNHQSEFLQLRDLSIQPDPFTGFNNVIPSCSNVISAVYTCVGIVTSIIQNGIDGNPATTGFTTNFPGNNGTINSGILTSSLSPSQGVGIIKQGPYIRNCTNFVKNSIGCKIDGFNSDEGDLLNTTGVQGSFNVDAFTQFNQNGIGVSVTNGAYCQLVSIFTICNDIGIYAGKGGQCDLTNSNSSFGTKGIISEGIGNENTSCMDRYTGEVNDTGTALQNIVTVSGLGNNRPYQGQALYFDREYFVVSDIKVVNGGSGYVTPPKVTVDDPTGPGLAIPVQATASIEGGTVTEILIFGGGAQFEIAPNVTIDPPPSGVQATAEAEIEAIYYGVLEATEPVAGISTISLIQNLNNEVGIGTVVYFARQSFQIVSSHSFQYIGSGNTISDAYPSRGGITITENEVIKLNGGEVTYTSTDQAGNFRIGDGIQINQATGTLSGDIYIKSLFTQVTPFILALGGD